MSIPRKKLVGKNPEVRNGIYNDDFLRELNKFATVNEVFGDKKNQIAKGDMTTVSGIVMGTLDRIENEYNLIALVMEAAEAGEWRAIEREPWQQQGLDKVVDKNLGFLTTYKDKLYLLPSPKYIAHCQAELEEQ
ncbi:MAG: hypothetical protein AABW58_04080 [Nanoarchaeota archaeon]